MPEAIIIAGPNGAGKTTFARRSLQQAYPNVFFLNADDIQKEDRAFANPVAAGRELLRRLMEMEERRDSFAVESTLASRMYAARIQLWRAWSYRTALHFIELPSADHAVRRVASRVAAGGHSIPENDIRRRYDRGLKLFHEVYKPLVDEWYHYFSDDQGLRLVERFKKGEFDPKLAALLEAVRWANWDARHGPPLLRSGRFRPESPRSTSSSRYTFNMTVEQLKNVLNAEPFRPFTIHMADRRTFLVKDRDFVSRSPSGRTLVVHGDDDGFSVLDTLLVTELEVHAPGKPEAAA